MKLPSRRAFLGMAGAGGLGIVGLRWATPWYLRARPLRRVEELSSGARELVRRSFADLDRSKVWDAHVHVLGLGAGGTGCWINPAMRSYLHPLNRLELDLYLAASGVTDEDDADAQYVARLLALHRAANPAGKLLVFGFDYQVDAAGREVPEASPFHTPDEYVLRLARENDDVVACASIHPYRRDAVGRLQAAAEAGAKAVKWLPNAMGIDPAEPRCAPFYARLAELGLPLITHVGLERAVIAADHQEYGNPLRLRRALDAGVVVVAAHCASLGSSRDLDADEEEELASFDLFLRLMGEKQYEPNLFGEISGLTQVNRSGRPLAEMLAAEELHPRLVNGSDYPLPAIDPLFSTRILVRRGYIDADQRRLLNEVFDANPLLFDLVLKRCVSVEAGGRERRFAPIVFESGRVFDR